MEDNIDNQIDSNLPAGNKAGFKHVFLVLRHPTETFRTVADAGHAWLYPFLIVIVLLLIGYVFGSAHYNEDASVVSDLALLSDSEQNVLFVVTLIALLIFGPPIYFLLAYVIPSAIFMFFGNFVFERHLRFKQYLNITAYALAPTIVLALINLIVMLSTGGQSISFSPASLLPVDFQTTFIGYWLSMFSLFNIWIIALLILGLSTILEQTRLHTGFWLIPLFLAFATCSAFIFSFVGRFAQDYGAF